MLQASCGCRWNDVTNESMIWLMGPPSPLVSCLVRAASPPRGMLAATSRRSRPTPPPPPFAGFAC